MTSPRPSGTGWPPDEPTPGRSETPHAPPKRRRLRARDWLRNGWARIGRGRERWGRFGWGRNPGRPARGPESPRGPKRAGRAKRVKGPKPVQRRTAAAEAERVERRQGRHNIMVATGILGLVLLAGVIGFGIWRAQVSAPYAVPAHVSGGGILAGGTGPVTVDVYADFACATCQSFALASEGTLEKMIAANQITLIYHPLARHDSAANDDYSTRAAASLGCASDLSHMLAYADALWAAEPSGTAGLSDDRLIQVAGSAGIIDPRFAHCVRDEHYRVWAGRATGTPGTGGFTGTPTVLVNGGDIAPPGASATPEELSAAIAAATSVAAPGK